MRKMITNAQTIKLIASDVDGTILQNGVRQPSKEIFELINRCVSAGILFVIASGRQYANLRRLFAPVREDVLFLAENGALGVFRDEVLFSCEIPREDGAALMRDIHSREGNEIMLTTERVCYISGRNRAFGERVLYYVGNTTAVVEHPWEVDEPWLKISAFAAGDRAHEESGYYIDRWSDRFHVAVGGSAWVDFNCTSKGEALRRIQEQYGVQKSETVALGDNFNDLAMFGEAGYAFAMRSAKQPILDAAGHAADTVEEVVQTILANNGLPHGYGVL